MNADMIDLIAAIALGLAAVPAGLFLLNLFAYRRLPPATGWPTQSQDPEAQAGASPAISAPPPALSVLIPARNEAPRIRATLESVLANRGCDFEVIVLDDQSTDGTASVVGALAAVDPRVRLRSAPPLPAGWCGKQHACHVLAGLARGPLLVFMDADVRLAPDALTRMVSFMSGTKAALASGVPFQELGSFSERLLLPFIHFLLLCYLPMHAMRRTRWPSMSGGCGQLFIARRAAYLHCGGHAMLRDSLHDGIQLPRVFRRAGWGTELFDATDVATCRMYETNRETWRGLSKNATEGLAAPGRIGPMTALLFGGQVLPFLLLACAPALSSDGLVRAAAAGVLAWMPRLLGIWRFRQPLLSAVLHPVGVLCLLLIQWHALGRHVAGQPKQWKGRSYAPARRAEPIQLT